MTRTISPLPTSFARRTSTGSLRRNRYSCNDSVSSLGTSDQQSLASSSLDEDSISAETLPYKCYHHDPPESTITEKVIAAASYVDKQVQSCLKTNDLSLQSIHKGLKSSKLGSIVGNISSECMISFVSGFILCVIFDITIHRLKRRPDIGFVGLLFHNQYVSINSCIIAYTYLSYLYRRTVNKLQRYIVRESSSIQTGDSICSLLSSLPDIFNLGLTCLITTKQVFYAFHLLALSVLILSIIVALFDFWIYLMNKKQRQQQQQDFDDVPNNDRSSSMIVQKNRKKATRTSRSYAETKVSTSVEKSLWFSMV